MKKPKPKWSFDAINALVAKLYECRRQFEAADMKGNPVFVLPSKNAAAREELERCLFAYFETKHGLKKMNYGNDCMVQALVKGQDKSCSIIHFPVPNVTLCLMDV